MLISGPEIEGRTFAFAPDRTPIEIRKPLPGEIENKLRNKIDKVIKGETSSEYLAGFDYSPTIVLFIRNESREYEKVKEDRDKLWKKLLSVMKKYGFNQNNVFLKIKRSGDKNPFSQEIRVYPSKYEGINFESLTTIKKRSGRVKSIFWYVS